MNHNAENAKHQPKGGWNRDASAQIQKNFPAVPHRSIVNGTGGPHKSASRQPSGRIVTNDTIA